jgi:hypothetical protein
MSWIEKNYEKAALGGAVVVALGLAYFGWSKLASVEEDFQTSLKGTGNNVTAVKDADLINKALASLKLDHSWTPAMDGAYPVELFTGIPLFVSSSAPESPIDLRKDAPVHPPIDNTWWIDHRIDPGYGDSPARDPDGDGFSNLEEFTAKTDPNDPESFPSLLGKLLYVKDDSLAWLLIPRYEDSGKFPFNYEDTNKGINKVGASSPVGPGELFFTTGVMKNRFKLLGSEVRKELNPKINIEMDVTIVRIEDQRPNKKGTIYEFPAPLNEQRKNEHLKYDRTAVFSLEALGHSGKQFKVEEFTTFSLPPDGAKKNYLVKEITPESVTIEYTPAEGDKETVVIKKGSMPEAN